MITSFQQVRESKDRVGGPVCERVGVNGEGHRDKKGIWIVKTSTWNNNYYYHAKPFHSNGGGVVVVGSFTIHLDFLLHCLPFWFLACHLPFQSDTSFSSLVDEVCKHHIATATATATEDIQFGKEMSEKLHTQCIYIFQSLNCRERECVYL